MDNKDLYEKAEKAIRDLFNDTDKQMALENLNELRDEIDILIDSLVGEMWAMRGNE
jgi:hypothetical protein